MLFQQPVLYPHLNVAQNIGLGAGKTVPKKALQSGVNAVLKTVGLEGFNQRGTAGLSGGEAQRVAFGRALLQAPKVILLDEPFTGIDPTTIHSIQDIIRNLKEQGIAILITDHRERELLTIADRSYIICAGQVIVSGNAEEVLKDPNAIASYFGKRFDADSIIDGRDSFRKAG